MLAIQTMGAIPRRDWELGSALKGANRAARNGVSDGVAQQGCEGDLRRKLEAGRPTLEQKVVVPEPRHELEVGGSSFKLH